MNIEEALKLLEEVHVAKDIKALQPKDRLNFWINLKEFETPKIQRSTFEPVGADDIEISIIYPEEEKDED